MQINLLTFTTGAIEEVAKGKSVLVPAKLFDAVRTPDTDAYQTG